MLKFPRLNKFKWLLSIESKGELEYNILCRFIAFYKAAINEAENTAGKEIKMLKKIFNWFFSILGGLVGYEILVLFSKLIYATSKIEVSKVMPIEERVLMAGFFVIIFSIIFYRIAPSLTKKSRTLADNIGNDLQGVSATTLIGGTLGLVIGMVVAYLLSRIYESVITDKGLYLTVTIIIYSVLAFLGAVIGSKKGSELINSMTQNIKTKTQETDDLHLSYNGKQKKIQRVPKILDTSVIIDGRILEILKTGFLEGPIVIPEFVLVELRHIADSSDGLKRNKGRRGLDILNKIQEDYGIEIYNTDSEKALKDIPEVDVKLLKLGQIMKAKVVTNDFNLNKVALIKGVPVLNINELSNALKPIVIPGEKMTVTLIKEGKDREQAIAYLDDGTMIVVEGAKKKIGETTEIDVTSVIQTAAGRMIFGKVR